ncbi:MAG: FAD-binding protein [Lachnospiraceae bacterium]
MDLLNFNVARCDLCGQCITKCPFRALRMEEKGIAVNDACRMCGVCVRICPQNAISFEQKAGTVDKSQWNDFLIYVEQENNSIHPVAYELIGEAKKMAKKVNYKVNCVIIGGTGTAKTAESLLDYGIDEIFVYEHPGFTGFKADCYTDALADCIANTKPSCVLIGATSLGRSMAPRLSTRFHTGLTADCTTLDINENTDMIQIRPAFGGNIMAQILISDSRPQFATVRYRVMDKATKIEPRHGKVTNCAVTDDMARSRIDIIEIKDLQIGNTIDDAEILVVAGRGAQKGNGIALCRELAEVLGGQLAFSRPLVEIGIGENNHQIGLSGRTVRPRLIITCGVSGAIQFTSCIAGSEHIVAINSDQNAQIFGCAQFCIVEDLYEFLPKLIAIAKQNKEDLTDALSL